jgi:hypothetical protein
VGLVVDDKDRAHGAHHRRAGGHEADPPCA